MGSYALTYGRCSLWYILRIFYIFVVNPVEELVARDDYGSQLKQTMDRIHYLIRRNMTEVSYRML